jgi:chromosome segregation ATPase
MLALDFIKANRETVERAIRDKGVDLDLGALLGLDTEIRAAKTEIEALRAERNAVSAKFKDASAEEKAQLGAKAKEAGARASALEGELADKEAALKALDPGGIEPLQASLRHAGAFWRGRRCGHDVQALRGHQAVSRFVSWFWRLID